MDVVQEHDQGAAAATLRAGTRRVRVSGVPARPPWPPRARGPGTGRPRPAAPVARTRWGPAASSPGPPPRRLRPGAGCPAPPGTAGRPRCRPGARSSARGRGSRSGRWPPARRGSSSTRVVLPRPGSPVTHSSRPRPAAASSKPPRRAARSCLPADGRAAAPGRAGWLPGRRAGFTVSSVSAASTSTAVGRRRGSFASMCWIRASRAAGTSGFRREGGSGVWSTMACRMPTSESAAKGCCPVASSYKTRPSEKMSVAVSTGSARACSGDMYSSVPTRVPGSVPSPLEGPRPRRRAGGGPGRSRAP